MGALKPYFPSSWQILTSLLEPPFRSVSVYSPPLEEASLTRKVPSGASFSFSFTSSLVISPQYHSASSSAGSMESLLLPDLVFTTGPPVLGWVTPGATGCGPGALVVTGAPGLCIGPWLMWWEDKRGTNSPGVLSLSDIVLVA